MSQKLFKPLCCHKFQYLTVLEKCCIPSAYLQWLFHSGERVVARGPLVFFFVCSSFLDNSYSFHWIALKLGGQFDHEVVEHILFLG